MRWGWVAVVAALAGCGTGMRPPAPEPPVVSGVQVGLASWYGPGFHGKQTANGEVYNQYDITAAHKTLPLGTRAMITNLANGRAVEVRINDRGPFIPPRVLDLSYGAARVLGIVGPGVGKVRIEVLEYGTPTVRRGRPAAPTGDADAVQVASAAAPRPVAPRAPAPPSAPPPPAPRAPEPPRGHFAVEIATLTDASRAAHLRGVIGRRFPEAHVAPLDAADGRYYRVRIGPYPARDVAMAQAEQVTRLGYPAILTEDGTE